ncbi:MAG: GTPase RsgA, partial [Anaerolineae bacterium]|nr:GTPase RsgA [Anaerolineae bacterium]
MWSLTLTSTPATSRTASRSMGRVLMTSARTGAGVEAVRKLLAGRVTLVAGHSGVGKSTLINAI